ncbi:uncharacterized protein LOC129603100 [Betta splendens]|uniref:Uncharacterized protein LOC129603100 n=1 Tax=Betta splendens TaxID=158456 RepID=A0A9W2XAV6_BETSP|nr:uncharacterized protein LOC129603100 [Betta splendens]XP_055358841.1 uncharacterized protein LOC129603100 [Betta splendens]
MKQKRDGKILINLKLKNKKKEEKPKGPQWPQYDTCDEQTIVRRRHQPQPQPHPQHAGDVDVPPPAYGGEGHQPIYPNLDELEAVGGEAGTAGGMQTRHQKKEAEKKQTKKQMMSFLGMTNYCRRWIPDYAHLTAPLQELMFKKEIPMHMKLEWSTEAEASFTQLKEAMTQTGALGFPDYSKPFVQTVDCKGEYMVSVLAQRFGMQMRPVAYYSIRLGPVARALPPCVRAVEAAAEAVLASSTIVLYHQLTLLVPHAISILLLQEKIKLLSPARHLSCMAVLLEQPHMTIERCTVLNPSTLMPTEIDGEPHDCLVECSKVTKPRPDLQDDPIPGSVFIYVDGSSTKSESGKTQSGYAVVTDTETLKAEPLPPHYSAQAAEIIALTEACKLMTGQIVTIYTDSAYAHSTIHIFASQWENRGMITSTGKPIMHGDLIRNLLKAIQLPAKIAVCKCTAHTNAKDRVSKGNAKADEEAKSAAKRCYTYLTDPVDSTFLKEMQDSAPKCEKDKWTLKGATVNPQGYYV